MDFKLDVMIMSGVEDGALLKFTTANGEGKVTEQSWSISVGRRDDNEICLRNDTYVSREHAALLWKEDRWWLQDNDSTNGTFVENPDNYFDDIRVRGTVPIEIGQIFRIGRTWLRIQPPE